MRYSEMSLEELVNLKNDLVGRYIGTWDKPEQYYRILEMLNGEIKSRVNNEIVFGDNDTPITIKQDSIDCLVEDKEKPQTINKF